MGKITLIRQGDVILRSIEEIPQNAEQVEETKRIGNTVLEPGRVVIMGETGHAHVLERAKTYLDRINATVYVEITAPTRLVHEEHPTVNVPPGRYTIYTVQDFVRGRRPLD